MSGTEAPVKPAPGTPRPVVDGAIAFDSQGRAIGLVGGRCRDCGTTTFPAKPICPGCWGEGTQDAAPLSAEGILYTYTVVRNPPLGFKGPYVLGYVDLPENLRVMARLDGEPPSGLKPGARVRIEIGAVATDDEGATLVGPLFRLEERGGNGA